MSEEEIFSVDSNRLEWESAPRGYYLTDVKQKVLWRDERTGATVALVKFPVGLADKVHSHPKLTRWCLVWRESMKIKKETEYL